MSAANEDEIIKRKLLIDGDGIGDDRRINIMLRSFLKWCSSNEETEEEQNINYERILLMLTNCEHAMAKSQEVLLMNKLEVQNYEELYGKIEKGIEEAQQRIALCKADLQRAKVIRRNKQEYDMLAKIILEHPDRKESLKRLSLLEDEIKKLQQIKEELNRKVEKRRKQFQVLLTSAYELQLMLQEEENNILDNLDQQSYGVEESKQPLINQETVNNECESMDISA
ncbi:THO complex subunit-like protein [Dinothrombium tinctorium]|uniref:THO complex subunit-like protein n=1 Tax=Dinothrombium tinctorium TaxID=1965070 RepID=A0A3S3PNW2_9ACAR|nr:THO complex subunit-like protein [Dinothrombium tinctorium]